MTFRFRSIWVNLLAAMAIASVAVGPSPSAAAAEMSARSKRDRAHQEANHPARPDSSKSRPSDSSKSDGARDPYSFVAPTSAKPADMQGGAPVFGVVPIIGAIVPTTDQSLLDDTHALIAVCPLHCLPHLPNAPPLA